METIHIPVILGTNRKGRHSHKAAQVILEELEKVEGVTTELFDVKDFDFPTDDYGFALKERWPHWHESVLKADGFALVFPEYNHSMPGVLKSLLDTHLQEYRRKAVGLSATSAGAWGGVRAIESALPIIRELGLVVTDRDMQWPKVREAFNEDGSLKNEKSREFAAKFVADLVWMARTLKWGRENLKQE